MGLTSPNEKTNNLKYCLPSPPLSILITFLSVSWSPVAQSPTFDICLIVPLFGINAIASALTNHSNLKVTCIHSCGVSLIGYVLRNIYILIIFSLFLHIYWSPLRRVTLNTAVEGKGIRLGFEEPGRPVTANGVSANGENALGTRENRRRYQIRMLRRVFV